MAREDDQHKLDAQDVKRIKFLNYNLFCLPWIPVLFAPRTCPLPAERANSFLKHIRDYDILALQEVWNPRFRNIEKYATRHGYHVAGSSAPSSVRYIKLRLFGGGLMIISKFPIVERKEIIYDQGAGADMFVTKGVLYAKLQVAPDSFIHVFNTHLQASYGYEWDDSNPYALIRKKQCHRISQFIHQMTQNDQHPIVLTGDFNVNAFNAPGDPSDSLEYRDMMRILQGPDNIFSIIDVLKEQNKDVHPVTYEGKGVHVGDRKSVGGQRLDFILDVRRNYAVPTQQLRTSAHNFVHGSVVPFLATDKIFTQISDHYGAHAVMELEMPRSMLFSPMSPDLSARTTTKEAVFSPKVEQRKSKSTKEKQQGVLAHISLQISMPALQLSG